MLMICDMCLKEKEAIVKEACLLNKRTLISLMVCKSCLKKEVVELRGSFSADVMNLIKDDFYLQQKTFNSLREKIKNRD